MTGDQQLYDKLIREAIRMGAFNVLNVRDACPACGHVQDSDVQFQYGDTWQHHYRPGDLLLWGGNDIGQEGAARVAVEGVAGPCAACGERFLGFEVLIENNVIQRCVVMVWDRDLGPEGYRVLDTGGEDRGR